MEASMDSYSHYPIIFFLQNRQKIPWSRQVRLMVQEIEKFGLGVACGS